MSSIDGHITLTGTFVDSNKEEDKDTVESSQNEIQKLEEIESENSEISNDDSM